MNSKKLRVLVTGGEGYLGKQYIKKLVSEQRIELVVSIDPRNKIDWREEKVIHLNFSVTDPGLSKIILRFKINVIAHFAWWFNPTHFLEKQNQLDLDGTVNMLTAATSSSVEQIIYTGSSTAYGQIPQNDHPLKEKEWENHLALRLSARYPYSANKARIDSIFQKFQEDHPGIDCFWTRAAIVLGKNTPNNVVSYVVRSPFTFGKFMFKVKGFDPLMQFLSEEDMIEVLFRATMEKWKGPVNVAGDGTILYSEVIKIFGRKQIELSQKLLWKLCSLGWNLRIGDKSFLKFPPSLIELIQYPWVGDTGLLKNKYGYIPKHSSLNALFQFKEVFN